MGPPVRVKVCGITSPEDALMAASLGVDAIGLNFHRPSPRWVDPDTARRIVALLPAFVTTVGVFVDAPEETVDEIADHVGLDRLQLHGAEDPGYCRRRSRPVIKVFRAGPGWTPEDLDPYSGFTVLLDAHQPGLAGGTGLLANWGAARILVERGHSLILAGGLSADNVAQAVEAVHPMAVDLNSGVETSPGRKDERRLSLALKALGRLPATFPLERHLTE
jgi:phosphoribosylanthranilate isomerase